MPGTQVPRIGPVVLHPQDVGHAAAQRHPSATEEQAIAAKGLQPGVRHELLDLRNAVGVGEDVDAIRGGPIERQGAIDDHLQELRVATQVGAAGHGRRGAAVARAAAGHVEAAAAGGRRQVAHGQRHGGGHGLALLQPVAPEAQAEEQQQYGRGHGGGQGGDGQFGPGNSLGWPEMRPDMVT